LSKIIIQTPDAPSAIGTYSQAVRHGDLVFVSGQIPLDPDTMELIEGSFEDRANQVFKNLQAVVEASGGTMDQVLKVNVFLTDLSNFATVNSVMASFFAEPFPARAAVGVASLPKGTDIEAEAVLGL
jgi:reactive intermediate/imine deaminase